MKTFENYLVFIICAVGTILTTCNGNGELFRDKT